MDYPLASLLSVVGDDDERKKFDSKLVWNCKIYIFRLANMNKL